MRAHCNVKKFATAKVNACICVQLTAQHANMHSTLSLTLYATAETAGGHTRLVNNMCTRFIKCIRREVIALQICTATYQKNACSATMKSILALYSSAYVRTSCVASFRLRHRHQRPATDWSCTALRPCGTRPLHLPYCWIFSIRTRAVSSVRSTVRSGWSFNVTT